MSTVRNAILDLLRAHDLTTFFGNPGSSELALLQDFPDDFRYFLGPAYLGPPASSATLRWIRRMLNNEKGNAITTSAATAR